MQIFPSVEGFYFNFIPFNLKLVLPSFSFMYFVEPLPLDCQGLPSSYTLNLKTGGELDKPQNCSGLLLSYTRREMKQKWWCTFLQ